MVTRLRIKPSTLNELERNPMTLPITDPNHAKPFVLTISRPTGDRLTRHVSIVTQYTSEAEALDAFKAARGKASLVELTGIGTCRSIGKR